MIISKCAQVVDISAARKINELKEERGLVAEPFEDAFVESDEVSTFKDIVQGYDVENISRNEINEMFGKLQDAGLVDISDTLLITFDPTHIPGWQDGVSSVNGWKMSSNSNEKMNFIDGFKTQLDFSKRHGDSKSVANISSSLDLMEKIRFFQQES